LQNRRNSENYYQRLLLVVVQTLPFVVLMARVVVELVTYVVPIFCFISGSKLTGRQQLTLVMTDHHIHKHMHCVSCEQSEQLKPMSAIGTMSGYGRVI
jgi:hypothetical protein